MLTNTGSCVVYFKEKGVIMNSSYVIQLEPLARSLEIIIGKF